MNDELKQKRLRDYHTALINSIYSFFKLNEHHAPEDKGASVPDMIKNSVIVVNPGRGSEYKDVVDRLKKEIRGVVEYSDTLTNRHMADNSIFITRDDLHSKDAVLAILTCRGFVGTISKGFIVVQVQE